MAKSAGYATLKRKLDKVFSEYVRRRYAGGGGLVSCVSCGVIKHWKEQQAGHFVSRVRLATRWDIENVNPQCGKCNVLLRGNAVGHARWLENRYGPDIFARLDERSRRTVKFDRGQLMTMIETYKGLIACLPPSQ
jgi:hypothetical protein